MGAMPSFFKVSRAQLPAPLNTSINRGPITNASPFHYARPVIPLLHIDATDPYHVEIDHLPNGSILNIKGLENVYGYTPGRHPPVYFNEPLVVSFKQVDGREEDISGKDLFRNHLLFGAIIEEASNKPFRVVWEGLGTGLPDQCYLSDDINSLVVFPDFEEIRYATDIIKGLRTEMRDAHKRYYSPLTGIRRWISSTLHPIADTKEENLVSASERRAMIGGLVVAREIWSGPWKSIGREMRDAIQWYYSPLTGVKQWISSTFHSIADTIRNRNKG